MGLIQFGFYNFLHPLVRPDGFFPQNMMLCVICYLARCSSRYRLDSRKEISKRNPNLTFPIAASMVNGTFLSATDAKTNLVVTLFY